MLIGSARIGSARIGSARIESARIGSASETQIFMISLEKK